jgi:phage terminase small subunit
MHPFLAQQSGAPNPSCPSLSIEVRPLTALTSTLGLDPHFSDDLFATHAHFEELEVVIRDS